jgi:hypothetical protein
MAAEACSWIERDVFAEAAMALVGQAVYHAMLSPPTDKQTFQSVLKVLTAAADNSV